MKHSKTIGKALFNYYKSVDHPFKLRIFFGINRLLDLVNYRIIIPYYNNNLLISLSLSDYIDRVIFQKGEYEAEVANSLFSQAVKDEVLWDIGGHIGSFAIKALGQDAIKKIYCFEPNPQTFEILTQNKKLNDDCRKLKIFNFGLGNEKTSLPYLPVKNGNTGGGKFVDNGDGQAFKLLPISTIDDLVFINGLLPPSLIKIDVEGFELSVLEGAKKTFELYPPKAIIFESTCTGEQLTNNQISSFLLSYNYKLAVVECEDEQGGPFKNFIATKY